MASSPALTGDGPAMPDRPPSPAARPIAGAAAALVALLVVAGSAAAWLVEMTIAERRQALATTTEVRLQALANGRADVLATWLDGIELLGRRLTGSELVQLFALELALAGPDAALSMDLAEQQPYMRQLLDDVARQGELVGAYLVAGDGRLLLADTMAPMMEAAERDAAAAVARDGASRGVAFIDGAFIDGHGAGILFDMRLALPRPEPQLDAGPTSRTALVLRVAVDARLARLLAAGPLDLADGTVALRLDELTRIEADQPGGLRLVAAGSQPPGMLRVEASLPGLGWKIEQDIAEKSALRPLAELERSLALGACAATLLLALAAGCGWWWISSRHQAALLAQYRDLAGRLRQQHDLLQGIMSAVPDLIGLKTIAGAYAYANPALGATLAMPPAQILGRSDMELFAADTAAALTRLDRDAAALGMARRDELEVILAGRRHHLAAVVAPLAGDRERAVGTVLVARDVTEEVVRRRDRERWVEQTIAALARAIELADPYLCGHSRRMAQLAEKMARELGLDPATTATIRISATLSQIGKLFVPRELLTKPGRHDEAEQQAMRRHVDHAQRVLRDLEFGLPVAVTLGRMHERLDGTGYPLGLEAGEIPVAARVLAVADVFCARTAPRSYRDASPAETVIGQMRAHPQRYDTIVVGALAAIDAQGHA